MYTLMPIAAAAALAAICASAGTACGASPGVDGSAGKPIPLWDGAAPGEKGDIPPEKDTTAHNADGKPVDGIIRLGNVSQPTITVFSPSKSKNTGAAVVVCPGGGYSILAYDLEGSEVCEWLNSIGVTGVLLKYRVPVRSGLPRYGPPFQDAQRALSTVRSRAAEWGIDPARIGILGFSAGGHLSALASTAFDTRSYPAKDAIDNASCRPDFTILIYPAYLTPDDDHTKLSPEIQVSKSTPQTFMAMTVDDPVHVENVFLYGAALKAAGVSFEMHVFPVGGHGYGLRPSRNEICHWPKLAEAWMRSRGLLSSPK